MKPDTADVARIERPDPAHLRHPADATHAVHRYAAPEELTDLVFLGRPALSNPHWPVWAARELAHPDPWSLVPEDWAWWLRNLRAHEDAIGWPRPATAS